MLYLNEHSLSALKPQGRDDRLGFLGCLFLTMKLVALLSHFYAFKDGAPMLDADGIGSDLRGPCLGRSMDARGRRRFRGQYGVVCAAVARGGSFRRVDCSVAAQLPPTPGSGSDKVPLVLATCMNGLRVCSVTKCTLGFQLLV
jgi:hypothetical protein